MFTHRPHASGSSTTLRALCRISGWSALMLLPSNRICVSSLSKTHPRVLGGSIYWVLPILYAPFQHKSNLVQKLLFQLKTKPHILHVLMCKFSFQTQPRVLGGESIGPSQYFAPRFSTNQIWCRNFCFN